MNIASFRYNGLVHKRSVGIEAAPDKKGFTVVYKRAKSYVSNVISIFPVL